MRLGTGDSRRRAETSGQDEVRRANVSTVLRLVHFGGAKTRSEIVAATGLNRSTVGALTAELVRLGLIRERRGEVVGKGRPSNLVEPVSHSVYVLAFDITAAEVAAARVGLGGYLLQVRRRLHQGPVQDVAGVVEHLAMLVREMRAKAAPGSLCLGVVVSVPASVRQPDGLVRRSPSLGWYEAPLVQLLAAALDHALPVAAGNDGDLGAIAEYLRGAARGSRDVLYVRGQDGIGGGVIVDGELLKGAGGYAGELGHIVVRPDGRHCACGARGCWEAETGDAAIIRAFGRNPNESDIEDVVADVATGSRRALSGVRKTGEIVGLGLATLMNIFNPDTVVLGGSFGSLFPTMEPTLHAAVARALGPIREQATLVRSQLGSDAQLVGAAEVAFADVLDHPVRTMEALLAVAKPDAPVAPNAVGSNSQTVRASS